MRYSWTYFLLALATAAPVTLVAADVPASSSGTFVSYRDGTLTLRGKSGGLVVHRQVGADYTTFENNEDGPGAKAVDTVAELTHAAPGTPFQIDPARSELSFGLDYRVIGNLVSYADGQLQLNSADVPPGYVARPAGRITLAIDPAIPVLESIAGARYQFAGPAGEVLKRVPKGTLLTLRSESDPAAMEVVQIGDPKQKIERYIGQTRATVRGSFVSYQAGVLRIRGKGLKPSATAEYERLMGVRVLANVPVVESVDGGPYQPVPADTLGTLKEGATVTIRKAEEIVLEIQIGLPRAN